MEARTPFVAGATGVRSHTARAFTRRTWTPPMSSRSGTPGSARLVTTVTSWPRRTSSAERVSTWVSTPPTYGSNQGHTWTIRMESVNPAVGRDDSPRDRAGPDERLLPDDRPDVDRRVDPRLHVVPHDHPELPEPGVDHRPPPRHLHVLLVEPEVRDLRPRPQVAPLPEDGVPHVVLMGDVGAVHQDGVLHLARVPDLALPPDRRRGTDEAVRTDLRVPPDERRALDVCTVEDPRTGFDDDLAEELRALRDLAVDPALQPPHQDRVRLEEVPRPADVDPRVREAVREDVAVRHQQPDRVRDLVLATRGLRGAVDEVEDVPGEQVHARVDQVRLRGLRLLLQPDDAVPVELHDPERGGVLDFRHRHHRPRRLTVELEEPLHRLRGEHDVAIHAEEVPGHVLPCHPDRVGGAEPLRLFLIRELHVEGVPAPEVFLHATALPPDEDCELGDPAVPEGLDGVREKRFPRHGEERFREVRGEGAHPRALPGAQDPRLHVAPVTFDKASS